MADATHACFTLFETGGSIPPDMLGLALRALGKTPSEEEVKEMGANGGVDEAQFKALSEGIVPPTKEEVGEAFSTFDMHGNGYMAFDDLKNVMVNLGEGLNPEEVAGMDAKCGKDADGQVNIQYFVDVLMTEF